MTPSLKRGGACEGCGQSFRNSFGLKIRVATRWRFGGGVTAVVLDESV